MTLKQLAQTAGVSVATVSKAFSWSREISESTRERIFELARQHGCFDKYYRGERARPLIALLSPEPESEFYAQSIGLLDLALRERGADMIVAFTRFDEVCEAQLFRELAYGLKVDAIIMWGAGKLIENNDQIPLIAITNAVDGPQNSDVIRVRMDEGMLQAVESIKAMGHTAVGFLGEKLTEARRIQFKDTMRRVGPPVHDKYIYVSEHRFERAGEDGMRALIDRGELPSAIVTAYDRIALGAAHYAKDHGYSIPEDISLVGIDDIPAAAHAGVPLTSLHTDLQEVCAQIVELVFKRIENKHYRSRTEIAVPVTVNIRDSLASIKEE